ncbi:hypothetical protein Bbelb_370080 [Branchiostoma belcheri]|nr:hypothetical protein Bbelb_370080 [Branchiostoma belcheri]
MPRCAMVQLQTVRFTSMITQTEAWPGEPPSRIRLEKTTVGIATIEPGREDSAGKEGESVCVCVLIGPVHAEARTAGCDRGLNVCGLRIYHPYVRVRATRVRPRYAYERATYGLRESNFTILTCNCCPDSARSTCVPRTVLASSVLTPHFPVDLLNDHAEHTCTIPDDLTGDCQLVSKMPRKAQKKTTRQDPKKRAAEDTRAASDDEVNRRCTHLQRASVSCRPRTYTLRNRASDVLPRPVAPMMHCATYCANCEFQNNMAAGDWRLLEGVLITIARWQCETVGSPW